MDDLFIQKIYNELLQERNKENNEELEDTNYLNIITNKFLNSDEKAKKTGNFKTKEISKNLKEKNTDAYHATNSSSHINNIKGKNLKLNLLDCNLNNAPSGVKSPKTNKSIFSGSLNTNNTKSLSNLSKSNNLSTFTIGIEKMNINRADKKSKLNNKPESNILVKINVLMKIFQDQNDLISLLNTKKENEFGFSPDTFIFLYEMYKSKMIEKIHNLYSNKGKKKKYVLNSAKEKNKDKTISTSSNFDNNNNNDIEKLNTTFNLKKLDKGTSTFLDNCRVFYSHYTNVFGQSSLKSSSFYFKTITESKFLTKLISEKIKLYVQSQFFEVSNCFNQFIDGINNNKSNNSLSGIYDIWLNNNKTFGIKLNKLIDEENLEKKISIENQINKQVIKLIKSDNKKVILRQLKKQQLYQYQDTEESLSINIKNNKDNKTIDTYNTNYELERELTSKELSNQLILGVPHPSKTVFKRQVNIVSEKDSEVNINGGLNNKNRTGNNKVNAHDYLNQKLKNALTKKPRHLIQYQEGNNFNEDVIKNLNTYCENLEKERLLLVKSYKTNKVKNVYSHGLAKYLESKEHNIGK